MNRTMKRILLVAVGLFLAAGLLARPASALFEDVYTFEGVLGHITETYITVVNEANVVVAIVVPDELKLPPDYQVGQRVWVELEKFTHGGAYRLRAIRKLANGESGEHD